MELPFYKIDAFTSHLFGGNPAGVVPLASWLPDSTLQAIAFENNMAETAFFVREGDGYRLRWFTPTVEVDICGHATLASGFVITRFLEPGTTELKFDTRSGRLTVKRQGEGYVLDFPLHTARPVTAPGVGKALGAKPSVVLAASQYVAVFEEWDEVAGLKPDMTAVAALDLDGVLATAPGRDGVDYVARYFAPGAGIPEDPATGSAQCVLMPYWASRLGRKRLQGRQISARIGDFDCEVVNDRVKIGGRAVCYLRGSIFVDG